MKFVDEFRDRELALGLAAAIRREATPFPPLQCHGVLRRPHARDFPLWRAGLDAGDCELHSWPRLPGLRAAHRAHRQRAGTRRSDTASSCAVMATCCACRLRSGRSLLKAKADGADVRMVYSVDDALKIARQNPAREVVFFAIGFETTTPPTPSPSRRRRPKGSKLLGLLQPRAHARRAALHPGKLRGERRRRPDRRLHRPVACQPVIGSRPYDISPRSIKKPVVIAGFEPLDVMQAILMPIRQLNEGRHEVENQYVARRHARRQCEGAGAVAEV